MNDVRSSTSWQRVKDWLPAILWAGVIFVFSTGIFSGANTGGVIGPLLSKFFPSISSDALDLIHWLVRKLGHFGEFFILALLIMRALHHQSNEHRTGLAMALTVLYAVTDELHQSLVPSRTASAVDVLIDVCGGVCGTLFFSLVQARQRTALKRHRFAARAERPTHDGKKS